MLFLATPLTLTETVSLHVESIWGAFIVGGLQASLAYGGRKTATGRSPLLMAALFFGLAANAKAVTLLIVPVVAIYLVVCYLRHPSRAGLAWIGLSACLFLVVGSVPYLGAYLVSGNPVFPFFNDLFQSGYYPAERFVNTHFRSGLDWQVLYRSIFEPARYIEGTVGAPGFQWLLLLPASVLVLLHARHWRALAVFAIAVVSIYLVFRSQSYLRYVFPFSAVLVALIALAAHRARLAGRGVSLTFGLAIVSTLGLNIVFFTSATWNYRGFPVSIVFSERARLEYLELREPLRLAVQVVNSHNLGRSPVGFLSSKPYGAGLTADVLYAYWYNKQWESRLSKVGDAAQVAQVLRDYRVIYLVLDDAWGKPGLREAIRSATDELATYGAVSVRRLRQELQFGQELLANPDLQGPSGWSLAPGAVIENGVATVSSATPVTQRVAVEAGRTYRNDVVARCLGPQVSGRIQLNWLDAKGAYLDTSITVFACTEDWQMHRMQARAPKGAGAVIVYGSAHGEQPILFDRISLR
ncbi:MAG: hypothetical protein R3E68_00320 [Burkholderiaceae bacterium]